MQPIRIGLVLSATPGYSETFFRSKILGLKNEGHQVTLFVGTKNKDFTSCAVVTAPKVYKNKVITAVLMVLRLLKLFLQAPIRAYTFMRCELASERNLTTSLENLYLSSHILPIDLDWLHFGFATMGLRKENTAKAMNAKMAVSLRGYDIAIYPVKHPGCFNLLWKRVDKVHVISDDLLNLAYLNGLNLDTPNKKIHPAIDVTKFINQQEQHLNFNKPINFLSISRLHWKKGIDYMLEAMALLHQKGIDFRFYIVGTGNDFERLVFTAYQLGISNKVFFKGKLPHNEVKKEMEIADIYLQYSVSEGFCNAVLEAQAMGCICIVSDAEGLPENVIDGETGFIVPKRNALKLSKKIEYVLSLSIEERNAMIASAKERVRSEFSLEQQKIKFIDFYTE